MSMWWNSQQSVSLHHFASYFTPLTSFTPLIFLPLLLKTKIFQNSLFQYANFGEGQHALVIGGQGFVGSHTVLRMLEEGYVVSVVDNSSSSTGDALERVKELVTGACVRRRKRTY